jgi:hypothetical protein
MRLIAHIGNIDGPSDKENDPSHIIQARKAGYDVEVDVWFVGGQFLLGHDKPTYPVDKFFLMAPWTWCHAKNLDALVEMRRIGIKHYFTHDQDDFALTSCHYIWTYPGRDLSKKSIAVMPELVMADITTLPRNIYGVCSDFVSSFNETSNL